MSISDDERAARAMGLSYGQYKALSYDPTQITTQAINRRSRAKTKHYKDEDAFRLWQLGMTDAEIAAACGVSRALIQKWRDHLELPSTARNPVDTKKYRLAQLQDGTYIVLFNE